MLTAFLASVFIGIFTGVMAGELAQVYAPNLVLVLTGAGAVAGDKAMDLFFPILEKFLKKAGGNGTSDK